MSGNRMGSWRMQNANALTVGLNVPYPHPQMAGSPTRSLAFRGQGLRRPGLPPEMTPQLEMEFARLHELYREAEAVPEQYGLLLTMCLLAYVDDDGKNGKGADASRIR